MRIILSILLLIVGCEEVLDPDTTAPTVVITYPVNNSTLDSTATVTVDVADDGEIGIVKLLVDGIETYADTTAPYQFVWDVCVQATGTHTLMAKTEDGAGNQGQSDLLTFTINANYDCESVCGGDKLLDNCEVCDADTSNDCPADCNGDWGGEAYTDECDDCVGGNTTLTACLQDDCGVWGGSNSPNTGTCDCEGTPNGTAWGSDCGCVSADNDGNDCDDCFNVPNGTAWMSDCGCVSATNSGDDCDDCAGTPNGDSTIDDCGTCDADTTNDCSSVSFNFQNADFTPGIYSPWGSNTEKIYNGYFEVYMNSTHQNIYGFQIGFTGMNIVPTLSSDNPLNKTEGGGGGTMTGNGLFVIWSENEGGYYPPGEGVLLEVYFTDYFGGDICFDSNNIVVGYSPPNLSNNLIVEDPETSLLTDWGDCITCPDDDNDNICDNLQGTVTDIDGNTYNTILIGTQTWMAENLKVTKYNNGDNINVIPNDWSTWGGSTDGEIATYSTDYLSSCGWHYNYYALSDSRDVCPAGWDVPTKTEFETLITYVGTIDKLKEDNDVWWGGDSSCDSNESHFSARGCGKKGSLGSSWSSLNSYGYFWTSTLDSPTRSTNIMFDHGCGTDYHEQNSSNGTGMSIRCLKD